MPYDVRLTLFHPFVCNAVTHYNGGRKRVKRNENKNDCFLTVFLLIMLAGCNNAPPNEDKPQPLSFSESVQSSPESEAPAGKESKEVETTPEAEQESEPEKQEETTKRIRSAPNSLRLLLKPGRRHSSPNNPIKRIRPNIPYPHRSRIFQRKAKRLRRLKRKKRRAKLKLILTLTTGFPL